MPAPACPPPFFPPLPLPEEMRAWDKGAADLGLPEILLMENAARAALHVLRRYCPDLAGKSIWLFMGSGNNGGDAVCLARHLVDAHARPVVLHAKPLRRCKGACARHVAIARASGVPFFPLRWNRGKWRLPPDHLPHIIIDGIMGTGFSGLLRPQTQALIETVNSLAPQRLVLALDIPSGLNARTGQPQPEAVRATATASFVAGKPGLALPCARPWSGRVHVCDIGLPSIVRRNAPCSAYLIDARCIGQPGSPASLPENSFKNTYGHVLVLGGASGYAGAAHLASRASLRAGAGLVTAAAPAGAAADIRCGWPEIMTLALKGSDHDWPTSIPDSLAALLQRSSALVVGPGLGRGRDAAAFLRALMMLRRPPTVFDADALAVMAQERDLLDAVQEEDILTPHPGEAAMLLGLSAQAVQADRWAALDGLCSLNRGVNILKGAGTLVRQKESPTGICPYDVPQLAIGGSGDVLAGCLGGLLASKPGFTYNSNPEHAFPGGPSLIVAGQGVALHALAGRSLAHQWPVRGNTAAAIADALPHVFHTISQDQEDDLAWPR